MNTNDILKNRGIEKRIINMKKLIVMVVLVCLGMISYSEGECKWISDPSVYERKEIALVVANKLTDKIYCDEDGDRMVYETGDQWNKELEIGLAYNCSEDCKNSDEIETEFTNDVNKILPNNISGSDIIMKPRYYNFRLYLIYLKMENHICILNQQQILKIIHGRTIIMLKLEI
jgi:hypothetical protein